MLRTLKQKKAQMVVNEYLITGVLAVAAVVVMGVYFKRAMQSNIYKARQSIVYNVNQMVNDEVFNGTLWVGYEPYYTERETVSSKRTLDEERMFEGGIFQKDYDYLKESLTEQNVLAPFHGD